MSDEGLQQARTKMTEAGVDPAAIEVFAHYYRLVESGETGMIPESAIEPLDIPSIADIDVLELNEAFAAQVVPCRDEWGIDPEKLNPFGGAIALGHPFGMTGARIMTTLLNNLDVLDGTIGLETMCVAGGMGQAMIVERLN